MDSHASSAIASNGDGISLQDLVRGERARALRAQLASWHPERSSEEVEDAIQTACKRFLEHAEMRGPGEVYIWIRTTAHRALNRETAHHARELAVDPVEDRVASIVADEPGPAEELISSEDDADLARLVEEVSTSLPERGRAVLALHGAGHSRPEIADRLGVSERIVKRHLEEIMDEARAVVARLSGGGCSFGEPLVLRFTCGLSTSVEAAQARDHLSHCSRCQVFCERLIAWREKAGTTLPAPAAEGASPGVLDRVVQKATDGLASVKQQIFDSGAQLKQQATTTYARAVEVTPTFAGARPGTTLAMVGTCVAIGGGGAYCVEKGMVDPIGAARGLIASEAEKESDPASPPPESESSAPVYIPAETPPPSEEAPPAEEAAAPEAEKQEQAEPSSQPPPPEDSHEPVRPEYMASESEGTESSEGTEETSSVESSPQPDPVPTGAGPQLGGP
jgi:RNA polymerase sigma factor (sigma-70 family)